MAAFVTGMHRSCTSLVAGLLGKMGFAFGADADLLESNKWNEHGFWERKDVVEMNQHLLRSQGADWYRLTPFRQSALPKAGPLVAEARAIVSRLSAEGPWSIKDPRLCLTLPFWRSLVSSAVCIFIHRNPLDIAASLQKRDGFPRVFSLALWEAYTVSAIRGCADLHVMTVEVESVFRSPVSVYQQLRRFLRNHGHTGLNELSVNDLSESVEDGLVHHRQGVEGLAEYLTAAQLALHDRLRCGKAFSYPCAPVSPFSCQVLKDYEDLHDRLLYQRERLQERSRPAPEIRENNKSS